MFSYLVLIFYFAKSKIPTNKTISVKIILNDKTDFFLISTQNFIIFLNRPKIISRFIVYYDRHEYILCKTIKFLGFRTKMVINQQRLSLSMLTLSR